MSRRHQTSGVYSIKKRQSIDSPIEVVSISKKIMLRSFNNLYFRIMMEIQTYSYILEAYDTAKQPPPSPLLSIQKLRQYINAEYNIFIFFLQLIIKPKAQDIRGSSFAQAIHDVVTLGNHKSYQ